MPICGGGVQSLSCVQLFATPWTAAHQASLVCQFALSPRVCQFAVDVINHPVHGGELFCSPRKQTQLLKLCVCSHLDPSV